MAHFPYEAPQGLKTWTVFEFTVLLEYILRKCDVPNAFSPDLFIWSSFYNKNCTPTWTQLCINKKKQKKQNTVALVFTST